MTVSEQNEELPSREELRQLRSLYKEAEEARRHLALVNEGVRGDMWYASERYRILLEERVKKINFTLERLLGFIDGIEDSRTRRVFMMHYVYGWTWQKIAFQIDASSESTPRLLLSRYLERLPKGKEAEKKKKA